MTAHRVLITSAGRRVSLLRAFQYELRAREPKGQVLACDLVPGLSPACQVADDSFVVPRAGDRTYTDVLLEECLRRSVGVVVPTIDTELQALADARERFAQEGVHVVVSSPELVATCRDKRLTNALLRERGIEVPREVDRHRPTFPLFVKPYDGSRSTGAQLIARPHDLHDAHVSDERLMFMEYLDSEEYEEHTVDLYYDRGHRLRCAVPRHRLEVRTGEVTKAVTRRNALVAFLHDRLDHLEGARGCLTAQFFFAPATGRIVGIEVNARFGGGFPLSYRAGANYPGWILDEYLNRRDIGTFDGWHDGLLMLRYDEEIVLDAAGARS